MLDPARAEMDRTNDWYENSFRTDEEMEKFIKESTEWVRLYKREQRAREVLEKRTADLLASISVDVSFLPAADPED